MSEMEDQIGSILGNPEMMQQIMAMAQSLGASSPPPAPDPVPAEPESGPSIDPAMIGKLMGLFEPRPGGKARKGHALGKAGKSGVLIPRQRRAEFSHRQVMPCITDIFPVPTVLFRRTGFRTPTPTLHHGLRNHPGRYPLPLLRSHPSRNPCFPLFAGFFRRASTPAI